MPAHIAVIGAGVIGLSTAIAIRETLGHEVTVLAQYLPEGSDFKNVGYTSPWAGAHHVSSAAYGSLQHKLDKASFKVMWMLSEPGSEAEHCFRRVQQSEYHQEEDGYDVLKHMPNFRKLESSELRPGCPHGVTFQTVIIDTHVYLAYLLRRFERVGGKVHRVVIQHIDQVLAGSFTGSVKPDALIVCAGVGARTLGGVEDKDVYPIRGQTVLLKAPWVNVGLSRQESDGRWTYVMPRRNGNVIIGGSMHPNDWIADIRPEITQDLLERAAAICPELAGPTFNKNSTTVTADDLTPHIIAQNCGMRPGRQGGIRIARELRSTVLHAERKVPVIYNYGHGGAGYQGSWGSADAVLELLQESGVGKRNAKL